MSAGSVHGGDRLPWVSAAIGGTDNFTTLTSLDWQVHVYGAASPDVERLARERHLPLHVFPWHPRMKRIGLKRNAAYLLRPDTYVALSDSGGSASPIAAWAAPPIGSLLVGRH